MTVERQVGVADLCVLVAEDEWIIQQLAVDLLEEAGHEVLAAGNGVEALELLHRNPGRFIALVTDMHMPPYGITGADLVEVMRKQYPTIPMIMTTAVGHAVLPSWLERHSVQMVIKPYEPNDLVTRLSSLLH